MKIIVKIVIYHFVLSLILWGLAHGISFSECGDICNTIEYISSAALSLVNFPGLLIAHELITYSFTDSFLIRIARDIVMVVSTELVLYVICIVPLAIYRCFSRETA